MSLAVIFLLVVRADPAEEEYLRLRNSSREVVQRNCGECHDGGLKTAKAKALKVFDTRDADWAVHMSEAQLKNARGRMQSDIVPSANGDAKPIKISTAERAEFDAYVTAELGRRASACK